MVVIAQTKINVIHKIVLKDNVFLIVQLPLYQVPSKTHVFVLSIMNALLISVWNLFASLVALLFKRTVNIVMDASALLTPNVYLNIVTKLFTNVLHHALRHNFQGLMMMDAFVALVVSVLLNTVITMCVKMSVF